MAKKLLIFTAVAGGLFLFFSAGIAQADYNYVSGNLLCSDNDGGRMPQVEGAVTIAGEEGYLASHKDKCEGSASLIEYYCLNKSGEPAGESEQMLEYDLEGKYEGAGTIWSSEEIECPYGCAGGRCLEKDACAGIECRTPPPAKCADSRTLQIWEKPGKCVEGECRYNFKLVKCPYSCSKGECIALPKQEGQGEPLKGKKVAEEVHCGKIIVRISPESQKLEKGKEILVESVEGTAEALLPGKGKTEREALRAKQKLVSGTTIYTGPFAKAIVSVGKRIIEIEADSKVKITLAEGKVEIEGGKVNVPGITGGRLKMDCREPSVRVEAIDFKSDMVISSPNASASPRGTHFLFAYLSKPGRSIIEVYSGLVEVVSLISGRKELVKAERGSNISRVEVAKTGEMEKKIVSAPSGLQIQESPADFAAKTKRVKQGIVLFAVPLAVGAAVFSILLLKKRRQRKR